MGQRLTEAFVRKAEPPKSGQRIIADNHRDAPRGFCLRVTPPTVTGRVRKSFLLRYRIAGGERRYTIGEWPTWSVEAARDEARQLKQQTDRGIDVTHERRAQRTEPTVADLVDEYLADHGPRIRSLEDRRRYLEGQLIPALGRMKVRAVSRRDIRALIEKRQKTAPVAARNLLAYVRPMFGWALERDLIESNPCAGIKLPAARKRARILDADEIRAFWLGLDIAAMRPLVRMALKLILVTGQRPGDVLGMTTGEIDGDTWSIPAHRYKTGDGHLVPLTPMALELIEAARLEQARLRGRAERRGEIRCLFTQGETPIATSSLARAVARNREVLGNKNDAGECWTPHDLRRTMRTGLAALKVPEHIAERVIGHRPQGIVSVYDQHRYEPEKRAALEAWERRLRSIITGEPATAEVVSIVGGGQQREATKGKP